MVAHPNFLTPLFDFVPFLLMIGPSSGFEPPIFLVFATFPSELLASLFVLRDLVFAFDLWKGQLRLPSRHFQALLAVKLC